LHLCVCWRSESSHPDQCARQPCHRCIANDGPIPSGRDMRCCLCCYCRCRRICSWFVQSKFSCFVVLLWQQ
jgi:hypothetical protein